jgi:hypothetical protein
VCTASLTSDRVCFAALFYRVCDAVSIPSYFRTSKKIGLSKNRQGKPLIDIQTTVDLIGSTTAITGLKVIYVRNDTKYELAKKVSDDEFMTVNITRISPFGAWNYLIIPH